MTKNKILLFSVTIDQCEVQTFTVGGNGGGGKDTSNTGVRIVHIASGAVGRAVETRSQIKNKRLAFERMAKTSKFRTWLKMEIARRSNQPTLKELVDTTMVDKNIMVETQNKLGEWVRE